MLSCPSCGSDMIYDPQIKKIKCAYCGKRMTAQEYKENILKAAPNNESSSIDEKEQEEISKGELYKVKEFSCPQCGAKLLTTEETAATFCNYCDSSILIESRIINQRKPDFIIPFKKTKQECEEAYKKYLRRAIFIPSDMKKYEQIEKFRGIYMPYWIYSTEYSGTLDVNGRKFRRIFDYIHTKHYDMVSDVELKYDNITFDASSKFEDNLSQRIAPFNTDEKEEFNPAYLSGFYADIGDVAQEPYKELIDSSFKNIVASHIVNNLTYKRYNVYDFDVERKLKFQSIAKIGFFPVWFLASRSKDGSRISYAIVNGQTGKVAAELPIDFKKYLVFTLILSIIIFILLNIKVTLNPIITVVMSIIFSIISIIISLKQIDLINEKENREDDIGYQYSRTHKTEYYKYKSKEGIFEKIIKLMVWTYIFCIPIVGQIIIIAYISSKDKVEREKIKKNLLEVMPQIIGIIAIIVTLALNPVYDIYYYLASAISMILVAISFSKIVKKHNLLASRKLPHLEKRGGDK